MKLKEHEEVDVGMEDAIYNYYNDPRLQTSKIIVPFLPFPLAADLVVLYFANPEAQSVDI